MAKPASKSTAMWVLRRLREAGHQALFAGGCVRDMLLGRPCFDYDVATDAGPYEVKRIFRHVLLVGAKFGVAMVIHRKSKVEVTTFRSDLSYKDGRRPEGVRFSSPQEDALRRDFTINGMFYDPIAEQVIDYVGGRKDLEDRIVRTIGSPQERFSEDYLRMLRAVRFAVRLEFRIEPDTAQAVALHSPKITGISGERIFDELSKMLSIPSAGKALALLAELRLAREIIPELFSPIDLWPAAMERVGHVAHRGDLVLTLGALLAALPAGTIAVIVRRWGASNDLRDALTWIAQNLPRWPDAADATLAAFKRMMGNRNFSRLRLMWAIAEYGQTRRRTQARRIARRARSIPPYKVAPKPFLNGTDLKKMGLSEGPLLGRIFRTMYDAQLNEQIRSRAQATALVQTLMAQEA